MNFRLIFKFLGYLCFGVGASMAPSIAWAVYYGEWRVLGAFAMALVAAGAAGGALTVAGRGAADRLWQREALAMVSLSWFVASIIGGLPFLFSGTLGPLDSFFETVSGFTTTGATVITDIEATPKSLLFWRSFTQWIGGGGIIMLFVAVLPYLGAGGKQLFKSETTGIERRSFTPRIKDTASALYKLYGGLTVGGVLMLMSSGMSFFDASCHAMSAISTGGFSPKQASVGAYGSLSMELTLIAGMVIGSVNFALMIQVIRRDWFAIVRDQEWRVYVLIVTAAIGLIATDLVWNMPRSIGADGSATGYTISGALRASTFSVVSIITTTGFVTDDFDVWPSFARTALFALMFTGACAGSTAGGIKIIRLVVLAKMTYWRVEGTFRPKTIRSVRIGDTVISDEAQRTVAAFFFLYVCWFAFGSLFMSALGLPFDAALSSVASSLGNVGPGLGMVGAIRDYSLVPELGKAFLALCMVLGRLEMFSLCVLFVPSFWKHR